MRDLYTNNDIVAILSFEGDGEQPTTYEPGHIISACGYNIGTRGSGASADAVGIILLNILYHFGQRDPPLLCLLVGCHWPIKTLTGQNIPFSSTHS
jgi:hypothetical protein